MKTIRKKYVIAALTLTLLLVFSTAAYAYNTSGSSIINNGLVTMTGYSITGADTVCDQVEVTNWFYRDSTLVDTGAQSVAGATYAQANVSASNYLGDQSWTLRGYHYTTLNGEVKSFNTTSMQTY